MSTDRPEGDLTARLVIACDSVNSFLARRPASAPAVPENFTLGAKEVLCRGRRSTSAGLKATRAPTSSGSPRASPVAASSATSTASPWASCGVTELAKAKVRPEELIAGLKRHPMVAPWVEGADLKEYSAHLIPEGGYEMMPELTTDGMLVAGDAAAMCLAAGIWLEGVNFAIGSGQAAGEAAIDALLTGDVSAAGLAGYRDRLEASFVLADHRRLRRARAGSRRSACRRSIPSSCATWPRGCSR